MHYMNVNMGGYLHVYTFIHDTILDGLCDPHSCWITETGGESVIEQSNTF
jgi:hypothetical protein